MRREVNVMGLWTDLYKFWTGFDSERPLHSHALGANVEAVQALVPEIRARKFDVNGYSKSGVTALAYCLVSSEYVWKIQGRYEIAILYLELGAKPYLPSLEGKNTNIHDNIEEKNIGAQRLLLWYDSDYEKIKDNKGELTAAERLNQKGLEEFKKTIEETAKDARAVKQLFIKAEELKVKSDFTTAVEYYKKAADVFKKHMQIEEKLRYQSEFENSRPILVNFYKKKIFQCYQNVEECYSKLLPTKEIDKAHLEILKYLANEATALKLGEQAIVYAKKIAELSLGVGIAKKSIQHTTHSKEDAKAKVEEQKPKDVKPHEDNEFTPLLGLSLQKSAKKIDINNAGSNVQLRKRLMNHNP